MIILMSMLEFIKYSKNKMIKKILILLPIVALSACATLKSEKLKEVEKECEYYNNTENYYNSELKKIYDNEKSAFFILASDFNSCVSSNCKIFASGNKWDFIEIKLNGDPSNKNTFPKNGDSGFYKITKDFDMYKKFQNISKDRSIKVLPSMSCEVTNNCISCSVGPFCLVGEKISNPISKISIFEREQKNIEKEYSELLITYNIKIEEKKFLEYNQYIYSVNNEKRYSSFGNRLCTNTKLIKPILIDFLGGYK